MSGLLVAIDPYIARLSSGSNVGYFGPINTTTLKLTQPDPDRIVRTSFLRSSYGQALDAYNRPKPCEIEFTIDDCDPDLLSMAMLGVPAAYTQTSAAGASETFTARLNKWVSLSKNNLSAFAISGKVLDTDYNVDLVGGLVRMLTGTEGASVTATISAPARSGQSIDAGTNTILQLAIRGVGVNLFTNKYMEINVWQANVSPSGALDFISKDPISMTFKGVCIVPSGKAGPYQYAEHA